MQLLMISFTNSSFPFALCPHALFYFHLEWEPDIQHVQNQM
jgi:hypothetical protein